MKRFERDMDIVHRYLFTFNFKDVDQFERDWLDTVHWFFEQEIIPAHYKALIRYILVKGGQEDGR